MLAILYIMLAIDANQFDLYIENGVTRTELNKKIESGIKVIGYADDVAIYLETRSSSPQANSILIKEKVIKENLAIAWFNSFRRASQTAAPDGIEVLYQGNTFWLIEADPLKWHELRILGAEVVPINKKGLAAARLSSIPSAPEDYQVIRSAMRRLDADRIMSFDQTMADFVSRFTYDDRLLNAQQWSSSLFTSWNIPATEFYYNALGTYMHFYGIKLDTELASYFGFIYKKVDGTWQTEHANIMILDTKYSADGSVLYLAGRGGLVGWNTVPNDYSTIVVYDTGSGEDLYGIYVEGSRVWACGKHGTLVYSEDSGDTWTVISTGITEHTLEEVGKFRVGPDLLSKYYVVGGNGNVLRSDDGIEWTRLTTVPGTSWLRDVTNFENNLGNYGELLVVCSDGTILTSPDGGDTWNTRPNPASVWLHCDYKAGRCWAAGTLGKLAFSDDFGETWTPRNISTDSLLENTWLTEDIDEAYVCGQYNAYYKTTDGGITWQQLSNPTSTYQSKNIVAELTGTTKPDEIVIVCAHQDSISENPYLTAPGAEDNASGSAVVMAVAEQMVNLNYERTVRFILFSGEEQGLLGSHAYADEAAAAGENIIGVLNADMIGYMDESIFDLNIRIASVGAELQAFTSQCAIKYTPDLTVYSTEGGAGGSDHESFSENGYQALTAIEHETIEFYPYYHTQQDTPDKLDAKMMEKTAQLFLATAMELATPTSGRYNDNTDSPYVFPNPLHKDRGQEVITFANLETGAKIRVFDLNGNLVSEHIALGTQHEWTPDIASGIYLYQVDQSGRKYANKLAIIK